MTNSNGFKIKLGLLCLLAVISIFLLFTPVDSQIVVKMDGKARFNWRGELTCYCPDYRMPRCHCVVSNTPGPDPNPKED